MEKRGLNGTSYQLDDYGAVSDRQSEDKVQILDREELQVCPSTHRDGEIGRRVVWVEGRKVLVDGWAVCGVDVWFGWRVGRC